MGRPGVPSRFAAQADIEVDEAAAIAFFDARARSATDASQPGVTMLQDSNQAVALQRSDVEVQALRALLGELPVHHPRTFDVGCGAGRLYAALHDRLGAYVGIDGAPALIAAARAAHCRAEGNVHAPAVRFAVHNLAQPGLAAAHGATPAPELVLMSGILIYLNDGSVRQLLTELNAVAAGPCTLVLREPVGVEARLTLRNHWSDELQAAYNAVYRTRRELRDLVDAAFGARLLSYRERWLYDAPELNNRVETRQAFMVARLGAVDAC